MMELDDDAFSKGRASTSSFAHPELDFRTAWACDASSRRLKLGNHKYERTSAKVRVSSDWFVRHAVSSVRRRWILNAVT